MALIHGVDWAKVMDDKVNALDAGVADTEKRMKRAGAAFKALDEDKSASLDTEELIAKKNTIAKTMKIKYEPSDDHIKLVRIATYCTRYAETVVCVCSS